MKVATFPSSHTPPGVRQPVEETQQKFIGRSLRSCNNARQSGKYVSADAVIRWLQKILLNGK